MISPFTEPYFHRDGHQSIYSTPGAAAAAAVAEVIRGWGPAWSRWGNRADEGPQSGPGTLCS